MGALFDVLFWAGVALATLSVIGWIAKVRVTVKYQREGEPERRWGARDEGDE